MKNKFNPFMKALIGKLVLVKALKKKEKEKMKCLLRYWHFQNLKTTKNKI